MTLVTALGRAWSKLLSGTHWPSWLLLWSALAVLRWQLLVELDSPVAFGRGFGLGLHADLVAALIPLALAWLLWGLCALPKTAGYILTAFAVLVVSTANVIYFRHFGLALDWWVLQYHLGDLSDIRGSAFQLGAMWRLGVALLLFAAACWLYLRREGRRAAARASRRRAPKVAGFARPPRARPGTAKRPGTGPLPFLRNRALGTLAGLGVIFGLLVLQQSPRLFHIHSIGHPLNSHVLQLWYEQNFKEKPFSGVEREAGREYGRALGAGAAENPGVTLARYQESRIRHFHATLDSYLNR